MKYKAELAAIASVLVLIVLAAWTFYFNDSKKGGIFFVFEVFAIFIQTIMVMVILAMQNRKAQVVLLIISLLLLVGIAGMCWEVVRHR